MLSAAEAAAYAVNLAGNGSEAMFVVPANAVLAAHYSLDIGVQWQGISGDKGDSTIYGGGTNFGGGASNIITASIATAQGRSAPLGEKMVVSGRLLDGMLFVQSRIGMNDAYVALFIVAAYTLFAALWTGRLRFRALALTDNVPWMMPMTMVPLIVARVTDTNRSFMRCPSSCVTGR